MALERVATSDLLKLIPTESKPTNSKPQGEPPKACSGCGEAFPERVVAMQDANKWATLCLSCKRKRYHSLRYFPPRYEGLTLAKCRITIGNKAAIDAAKAWVESNGDGNLWFHGDPGTGKTHVAAAAANDGPIGHCYFVNVAMMLLDFQASVKEHEEREMIARYSHDGTYTRTRENFMSEDYTAPKASSVLFDDVGAHRVSDFGIEMFGLMLEHFYSYDRTGLIFTSNLSPAQILVTMGERISSRLKGLARPIKIEGKDMRFE